MDSKSSPAAEGLRARRKPGSGDAELTKVGNTSSTEKGPGARTTTKKEATSSTAYPAVHAQVAAAQVYDILSVLLFFRFVNALCVRTFFQPDEYFQALEPAWDMAFGNNSGAWLTWVPYPDLTPFPLRRASHTLTPARDAPPRNGNTSLDPPSTRPSLPWHTAPLRASCPP